MTPTSGEIAQSIAKAALSKKARDILMLDLRELSEITDFFVVCSGDSNVQVRAITDQILESVRNEGTKEWHVEGYGRGSWVLIDYVEVVAHIFLEDARVYYGLEDLWGDAPGERVEHEDTRGQETAR